MKMLEKALADPKSKVVALEAHAQHLSFEIARLLGSVPALESHGSAKQTQVALEGFIDTIKQRIKEFFAKIRETLIALVKKLRSTSILRRRASDTEKKLDEIIRSAQRDSKIASDYMVGRGFEKVKERAKSDGGKISLFFNPPVAIHDIMTFGDYQSQVHSLAQTLSKFDLKETLKVGLSKLIDESRIALLAINDAFKEAQLRDPNFRALPDDVMGVILGDLKLALQDLTVKMWKETEVVRKAMEDVFKSLEVDAKPYSGTWTEACTGYQRTLKQITSVDLEGTYAKYADAAEDTIRRIKGVEGALVEMTQDIGKKVALPDGSTSVGLERQILQIENEIIKFTQELIMEVTNGTKVFGLFRDFGSSLDKTIDLIEYVTKQSLLECEKLMKENGDEDLIASPEWKAYTEGFDFS